MRLDVIDEKIMESLQKDAWQTYVSLGEIIGLSASAVQRRVERLKRDGILLGATAQVAPRYNARGLRIFLFLELVSDSKKSLERLGGTLRAFPGFDKAYVTIGATDVLVLLNCKSMEEFQVWSMSTLNEDENIRHCTTLVNLQAL